MQYKNSIQKQNLINSISSQQIQFNHSEQNNTNNHQKALTHRISSIYEQSSKKGKYKQTS